MCVKKKNKKTQKKIQLISFPRHIIGQWWVWTLIANHMIMTSDFRATFELNPETMPGNHWSYIRDEIFSILKMCHSSGPVVPCVDAHSSHRHTLGEQAKIEMEMHRISHRSSSMFRFPLQMWVYVIVRVAVVNMCCKDEHDHEKDVYRFLPLLIAEPAVAWSPLCGNSVWQMRSKCLIIASISCDVIAFPSGCQLWGHPISNVGSHAHKLSGLCQQKILPRYTPIKAHFKDFSSCH